MSSKGKGVKGHGASIVRASRVRRQMSGRRMSGASKVHQPLFPDLFLVPDLTNENYHNFVITRLTDVMLSVIAPEKGNNHHDYRSTPLLKTF